MEVDPDKWMKFIKHPRESEFSIGGGALADMKPKSNLARVFAVQERNRIDLSDAWNYGEVVVCLPESKHIFDNPRELMRTLELKLKGFSDNDFLLAIGDPAAIAVASVVALRENGGKAKMLRWDNKEHKYKLTNIDMR